jgi:hypothetical protein
MSSLTELEKLKLEAIFNMAGGYVLDFNDRSFSTFIHSITNKNIHDPKYAELGTSKANKLRAFWRIDNDIDVGNVTQQMLERLEAQLTIAGKSSTLNTKLYKECYAISTRILGKQSTSQNTTSTIADFLKREVDEIKITSLNIDNNVTSIIEQRIIEVKKGIQNGASLSVIFLCGSILEGVLLGVASMKAKEFNQATSAPKDNQSGKPKLFHQWTLSNFIDVAHEIGYLGLDVKKHGHSLRDFRNYIHPFEQMSSRFNPDEHTAKISWQVLKAALHDIHQKTK